ASGHTDARVHLGREQPDALDRLVGRHAPEVNLEAHLTLAELVDDVLHLIRRLGRIADDGPMLAVDLVPGHGVDQRRQRLVALVLLLIAAGPPAGDIAEHAQVALHALPGAVL